MAVRNKKTPHAVGWVRGSPRYPAKGQSEALDRAGVRSIYSTADGETLTDLYRGLVAGDCLHVVGVHRLGSTRAELAASIRLCRERGVTVRDLEVGADVDLASYEAITGALGVINGEVRMAGPELARKRRDYTNSGRKVTQGAMSVADAQKVWTDLVGVPTDDEAATITGWHRTTLWRKFGRSGRKAGWPKRIKR